MFLHAVFRSSKSLKRVRLYPEFLVILNEYRRLTSGLRVGNLLAYINNNSSNSYSRRTFAKVTDSYAINQKREWRGHLGSVDTHTVMVEISGHIRVPYPYIYILNPLGDRRLWHDLMDDIGATYSREPTERTTPPNRKVSHSAA